MRRSCDLPKCLTNWDLKLGLFFFSLFLFFFFFNSTMLQSHSHESLGLWSQGRVSSSTPTLAKPRLQISRTFLPHQGPLRASNPMAPFTDGNPLPCPRRPRQVTARGRTQAAPVLPGATSFSPLSTLGLTLTPTLWFQIRQTPYIRILLFHSEVRFIPLVNH